jgi:integrase
VAAWLNGLDLATATRINTKKALSQVLNAALRWGYLAANPVRDVRLGNTTRPPIRPFESWAEVDAIAKHAGAYGHAITFAAATGFRPQEWLALRWQDLDIPARKATVNQTLKADRIQPGAKNEESERTIRLPSRALQALAGLARPLDRSRLVFLTPEGDPWTDETFRKRIYRPALEASGIAPRGLKELRHTFASLALAAGAQIQDVSRHLGHKDITTTLTYYAKFLPETEERFLATLDSANTSSGGTAVAQEEGRG